VSALSSADDADSVAVAAELGDLPGRDESRRLAALGRAVALAPNRPDLVWLQLIACAQVATCDPTPLSMRLHSLDPENGAAWATLLDRAADLGDGNAVTRCMQLMANSREFDVYWNRSIAHLATALVTARAADTRRALIAVIGREAALALPAYEILTNACRPPALDDAARLNACRGVAITMRRGDTYLTEMIGIAIAKRAWPKGSAEYASAAAARRLGEYRMHAEAAIALTSLLWTNAEARKYLQLLSSYRTEQEVALAIIRRAGKNTNPPADWKDSVPGGS
jgi:hypothetical protein